MLVCLLADIKFTLLTLKAKKHHNTKAVHCDTNVKFVSTLSYNIWMIKDLRMNTKSIEVNYTGHKQEAYVLLVQGNGDLTPFAFDWLCRTYTQLVDELGFDAVKLTPTVWAAHSTELAFANMILKGKISAPKAS